MRRSMLLLPILVCLLAAGCGGTAAVASPAGSPSPAPASVAPAESASPAASASPDASAALASTLPSGAGSTDATALCAFLSTETPLLQKAGSTGGAVAQLAIDYADWISTDASRVLPDAAAMDSATVTSCPAIRSAVLKLIGSDSFANGL